MKGKRQNQDIEIKAKRTKKNRKQQIQIFKTAQKQWE